MQTQRTIRWSSSPLPGSSGLQGAQLEPVPPALQLEPVPPALQLEPVPPAPRVSSRGGAEGKLPSYILSFPPEILNINQQNNHL